MKLTEQQLAALFKHNKTSDIDIEVNNLLDSTDASEKRILDVEKIADNSHLSASYQVIHRLQDWSKAVSQTINTEMKIPSLATTFLSWLKPSLATAALVTAVYFIIPNVDNSPITQDKPETIMFSGSFEKGKNNILPKVTQPPLKPDVIYKGNFG